MPIEKIHGPDVQQRDKEGVLEYRQRTSAEMFDELKSKEVGRTEWHERMITVTSTVIRRECERLGISSIEGIPADHFIFVSSDEYHQHVSEDYYSRALYFYDRRLALLNAETPRNILFTQQMHESIHAYSYHDSMVFPEKKEVLNRRVGVSMIPPTQGSRFNGLNEAVTERLRWKLSGIHRKKIQKTMEFSDDEMVDITHAKAYSKYIALLDSINDRIAEEMHTTRDACWDMWTKAMITGEMMSLRQIERVWGEGSLRILSMLGYDKKIDAKVFKFFGTMSHDAAEKIRRELLAE